MRRIALCLYALALLLPVVGCKKDETAPKTDATTTDAATPAEGDTAK
jgi:hypothetical protein